MGGGKRSSPSVTDSLWNTSVDSAEPYTRADGPKDYDYDDDGLAGPSHLSSTSHVDPSGRGTSAMAAAGSSRARGHGRDGSVSGELLECTVGSPIKEGDGTKDAFISYLVTTHVGVGPVDVLTCSMANHLADHVCLVPETT